MWKEDETPILCVGWDIGQKKRNEFLDSKKSNV